MITREEFFLTQRKFDFLAFPESWLKLFVFSFFLWLDSWKEVQFLFWSCFYPSMTKVRKRVFVRIFYEKELGSESFLKTLNLSLLIFFWGEFAEFSKECNERYWSCEWLLLFSFYLFEIFNARYYRGDEKDLVD